MATGLYVAPPESPSVRGGHEQVEAAARARFDARLSADAERLRREDQERRQANERAEAELTVASATRDVEAALAASRVHDEQATKLRAARERAQAELRQTERQRATHAKEVEQLRLAAALGSEADAEGFKRGKRGVASAEQRASELREDIDSLDRAEREHDATLDRDAQRHAIVIAQRRLGEAVVKELLEEADVRAVLVDAYAARQLGGDGWTWERLVRHAFEPPHESEIGAARERLLEEHPQLDGRLR